MMTPGIGAVMTSSPEAGADAAAGSAVEEDENVPF
jgi:hypothetical protein